MNTCKAWESVHSQEHKLNPLAAMSSTGDFKIANYQQIIFLIFPVSHQIRIYFKPYPLKMESIYLSIINF